MIDGYPKMLKHPAFQPAVISRSRYRDPGTGQWMSEAPGSPIRFPPVWVNNPDQEEFYRSRGYA